MKRFRIILEVEDDYEDNENCFDKEMFEDEFPINKTFLGFDGLILKKVDIEELNN